MALALGLSMGTSAEALSAEAFAEAPAQVPATTAAYGKVGGPVRLEVGYMPYQSSTWSGVVMRGKKFYDKYLPRGSSVEFTSALEGGKIASALRAGVQQIGYLADALAVSAAGPADRAALPFVAVLGVSHDQCSVLLVRADAPRFASASAAIEWLGGRTLAAPKDSCMERFARRLMREHNAAARLILDQNIEVITASFRAGRLDAAVVSEPSASRLIDEGLVRRVASGHNLGQLDRSYLAMSAELIEQRPDVARAWLRAEIDAQRFLADPANAAEVVALVAAQTTGFSAAHLWQGLYGRHSELEGGSALRMALPFTFDAESLQALEQARAPASPAGAALVLARRPVRAMPELARRALAEAGDAGLGAEIRAMPQPLASAALAGAGAGAGSPAKLSITVEPGGWMGGDPRQITTVLEAVAAELLARFPGRPLAPIRVSRSAQAPVVLYDRGPAGEYRIELAASGSDPSPYVYEFAHEFCHVLSNYDRHPHHVHTRKHQWFEEALCEVASLYALKTLGAAWQKAAPSPALTAAAPALLQAAERLQRESHRRLPPGTTLAAWFETQSGGLGGSAYERDRNEIVANLLLPWFEENPELWEAIGFLNLDATGATFQQYLQNWLDNAPPRYQDVIRHTLSLFFAREPGRAQASVGYPLRPIEIIVTFGPGGGADSMARKLGALLEPVLGVPVLVRNVPGASGNAGLTRFLLSSDPDHTLVTLIALTAAAWAGGVGSVGPADFTVLGTVQDSPSMLFVAADSPFQRFESFLAQAKAEPGRLRVATSGYGTLDDVTLAFLGAAGYRTSNAPFAKPEERYDAALQRRTDALFEEPGDVAAHLASGRLRPLVTFSNQRHPAFVEVPAITEFGLAIGDLPNFRTLAMQAGTAPEKVKIIHDALHRVLASAEWQGYCAQTYSCITIDTPEQAKARVQSLVDKVSALRDRLAR